MRKRTKPRAADGDGTRVDFVAEGELRGPMRFASPLVQRMRRQLEGYHEHLRTNVESTAHRDGET